MKSLELPSVFCAMKMTRRGNMLKQTCSHVCKAYGHKENVW